MLFCPVFACTESRSVHTELRSAAARSRTDSLVPMRGLSPSSLLTSLLHYFLTSLRHYPLSPLQSALPKDTTCNLFRIRTYKTSRICIKTNDFNGDYALDTESVLG